MIKTVRFASLPPCVTALAVPAFADPIAFSPAFRTEFSARSASSRLAGDDGGDFSMSGNFGRAEPFRRDSFPQHAGRYPLETSQPWTGGNPARDPPSLPDAPNTVALLGLSVLGLAAWRRRTTS